MAELESLSAAEQKMDFMTLLITQMQNQNPLDPMSNQEMAAQLAQFAQLERMEEMSGNIEEMNSTMGKLNSTFQGSLLMAEYDYAKSLLSKEVTFYNAEYNEVLSGRVDQVKIDPYTGYSLLDVEVKDFVGKNGTVNDMVGVRLADILGISEL